MLDRLYEIVRNPSMLCLVANQNQSFVERPAPLATPMDISIVEAKGLHMNRWKRIKDKNHQTKDMMHETQERAVTDRLWPEIETLNRVLNEILVLSRQDEGFFSKP